ncbi:MAG: hypothetical protein IJ412_11685 [Oscillospiraceae bacterium]|nr:hypothetical protein [Oscillospiraceae bacterium]
MGQDRSTGDVVLGVLAGAAVGMIAAYALSGDSVLLRHNLRKMERGAERTIHRMEKYMR